MADTLGVTLSHADADRRRTGVAAPAPLLVLALECSRPGALSARWSLAGLAAVHLGRGGERKFERTTSELTIRVPDRWMSSRHARIENSFGRWVLVDTDSKNGTVVNGQTTRRAVLADGDLIELGHTLFLFLDRVAMYDDDPVDVDLGDSGFAAATPGLATLVPEYARELTRLREVAASDISVLIEGESGTGKELLARAIHAVSGKTGAFVAVNCGALPANLVESELFGYKRGAFSGANTDQPGLVRSADGGTLFLDEIGDLPAASQAALLRVLQEREVMPVGGTRPVAVDLRVVAATHRELDEMIASQHFRHDLFARLAGFRIEVPPLSERRADLGLLVGLLHQRLFGTGAGPHPGFDVEAARMILRYPWPLNVRELEQALATAAVLAKATEVAPEHLPETVRTGRAPGAPKAAALSEADQRQRDELVRVLREHFGNISAVARAMGKDRKQIQRWIKRFAIDTTEFRA